MPVNIILAAAAVVGSVPLLLWAVASARSPQRAAASNLSSGLGTADLRNLLLARSAHERVISPLTGSLADVVRRFTPASVVQGLQRRVEMAGSPPAWPLERVLAAKLLLGGFGGLLALAELLSDPGGGSLLLVVLLPLAGLFLPDLILRQVANGRRREIRTALPDTLDQLTVCVEAGLGFDAALARTARTGEGPLAEELQRTMQETRVGASRAEALGRLAARTQVTELRRFVQALTQAELHGIPVAHVLRTQAGDLRVRRRQRAEEHAHKIPVKLIFPLVTCILPSLMIVILGPAGIRMMRFFSEGAVP